MKKNCTELVFILDRSGSMAGLERDTIGGFNAMIEKQKKQEGECLVNTVLFSNDAEVIHDRVQLERIEPMTDRDYTVGGCTALLDAIGGAIRHISTVYKYARPEDVPEHTLFVITTDGMENASRKERARLGVPVRRREHRRGADREALRHRRGPCGQLPRGLQGHARRLRDIEQSGLQRPQQRPDGRRLGRRYQRRLRVAEVRI